MDDEWMDGWTEGRMMAGDWMGRWMDRRIARIDRWKERWTEGREGERNAHTEAASYSILWVTHISFIHPSAGTCIVSRLLLL